MNGVDNKSGDSSAVGKSGSNPIPPLSHDLFLPGGNTVTPPPKPKASNNNNNKRKAKAKTENDNFLKEASLEFLLKNYTPSRLSQRYASGGKTKSVIYKNYLDTDILFGRGTHIALHPGNLQYRTVIAVNQPFYKQASRDEKHVSADCLVKYFEDRGTRFLEFKCNHDPSQGLVPVPYPRVVEKFMQALREKITYRRTGVPPPPQPPKTATKAAPVRASQPPVKKQKRSAEVKGLVKKAVQYADSLPKMHAFREAKRKAAVTKGKDKKKKAAPTAKVAIKAKMDPPKPRTSVKSLSTVHGSSNTNGNLSVSVGDRLAIYWDLDKVYYPGLVRRRVGSKVLILYDDQEQEWVDLAHNKFIPWNSSGNSVKNTRSNKTSLEYSIQTQDSTDSENIVVEPQRNSKETICIQGSFAEHVVAPSPCLATFLRRKLNIKGTASVPGEAVRV